MSQFRQRGGHDSRCEEIPFSRLVAEAEAEGETVPESVRDAAERGVTIGKCHPDCPIGQRDIARGIELAERFGW